MESLESFELGTSLNRFFSNLHFSSLLFTSLLTVGISRPLPMDLVLRGDLTSAIFSYYGAESETGLLNQSFKFSQRMACAVRQGKGWQGYRMLQYWMVLVSLAFKEQMFTMDHHVWYSVWWLAQRISIILMISTISIPEWAPWWDRSQKGLCRLPSFCDLGSKSFCRSSMKPTTACRESFAYLSVTCSLKPGKMSAWATSSTREYWRFCDPLFSKQISSSQCVICDFMCLQKNNQF